MPLSGRNEAAGTGAFAPQSRKRDAFGVFRRATSLAAKKLGGGGRKFPVQGKEEL
jgi:hypothetical protein